LLFCCCQLFCCTPALAIILHWLYQPPLIYCIFFVVARDCRAIVCSVVPCLVALISFYWRLLFRCSFLSFRSVATRCSMFCCLSAALLSPVVAVRRSCCSVLLLRLLCSFCCLLFCCSVTCCRCSVAWLFCRPLLLVAPLFCCSCCSAVCCSS
jgi:hypothetical protein